MENKVISNLKSLFKDCIDNSFVEMRPLLKNAVLTGEGYGKVYWTNSIDKSTNTWWNAGKGGETKTIKKHESNYKKLVKLQDELSKPQ